MTRDTLRGRCVALRTPWATDSLMREFPAAVDRLATGYETPRCRSNGEPRPSEGNGAARGREAICVAALKLGRLEFLRVRGSRT
jgi:hypothetical protein